MSSSSEPCGQAGQTQSAAYPELSAESLRDDTLAPQPSPRVARYLQTFLGTLYQGNTRKLIDLSRVHFGIARRVETALCWLVHTSAAHGSGQTSHARADRRRSERRSGSAGAAVQYHPCRRAGD